MFVRRSRTPRTSAGTFSRSGHDPVVTKNGAGNGAVFVLSMRPVAKLDNETDPPDYNSHHPDSDGKIGCRPDRTGDNPDDASADDPERNEIAEGCVAHLDTYPSGPFARSGHGCFNAVVLVDLCIWVGGPLPLGYDLKDGTLVVVEEEAERVRMIFRRYLEVSGINELVRDLRARNICTKARTYSTGKTRGGIPFGRAALSYFLRNRFFIGEVNYKGEVLPGEQPAIMDKALFEAVQQKLSAHQSHKTLTRQKSDHLLKDLLFDDAGHHMIATHATKAGVRYRYYVSQPGLHGEARTAQLGSVSRVPAADEQAIVSALRKHLTDDQPRGEINDEQIRVDRTTLATRISHIEVQRNQLVISVKPTNDTIEPEVLSIPWQKPPSKRARKILLPHGRSRDNLRSERAERRTRLVSAIARGRRWLDEIVTGSVTDAGQLAKRERCTVRQVNMTLSLAFLAPQLVKAAVEGRLPRGINIERLRDPHAEWGRQFEELGLSSN
jgi:site-specific DNA recombinase